MNYSDIQKKYGLGAGGNDSSTTSGKKTYSDIANKHGISYDVDENYINSFLSDANSFLGSAEKDYGAVGWGNASSSYTAKKSAWADLDTRVAYISRWLEQNKDRIGLDTYNSFVSTLDNFNKSAKSVVDSFKSASDYYSQWDSEDAYKAYERQQAEYNKIKESDDFADNSKYVSTQSDNWWDKLWSSYGLGYDDIAYEYINNQNEIRDEIKSKYKTFSSDNMFAGDESKYEKRGYDFLKEEEIALYNYFYNTEGEDRAQEFLDSIEKQLVARKAGEEFASLEGDTLRELLYGIVAGADQFRTGIENLGAFVTGDEGFTSSTQYVSGMVREDLADNGGKILGASIGQIGYDLINTTTHMLPSILIGAVTGGVGGALAIGLPAVGNAYAEMRSLGYDEWQSRGYAFLVGASEATLQYFLGGISSLGGKASGGIINKIVNKFDNAIARTAIKLGGNMVSEGVEEALQEVLDPVFKSITTGEDFEGVDLDQVMYSGLLGALSAGVLEGGGTISGEVKTYKAGKEIKDAGGVERLTKLGSSLSADTVAYKIAGKVNENTGAYTIGRLYQEVGATISEQNVADIASALEEKGMSKKVAKKLAKQYQSFLNGEMELTDAQISVMENLDPLSDVLRKNIIGRNTTIYQRTRAYSDVITAEDIAADVAASQSNAVPLSNEELARRRALAESGDFAAIAREIASQGASAKVETQNASERKFSTSDDGKTVLIDTNEEVEIQGIASIENGKVKLRTNKGEVDAEKISFGTDNDALLYEAVTDMTAEAARNMIDSYDPNAGTSTSEYIHGFKDSYRYGFMGFAESELAKGVFTKGLSEAQRHIAYTVGKNAGEAAVQEAQRARTEAKKRGENAEPKKGKVFINGKEYSLGDKTGLGAVRDASVKGTYVLAEVLGTNVHFYESYKNKEGKRVYRDENGNVVHAPHGFYTSSDGSIHIDLNAGAKGEGLILYTVSHELTHFIRDWSPAKFKVFADFLLENYAKKGKSVEALVQAQIEKAAKNGREISFDEAYEEVIADSCQAMLEDGSAIQKIAELKAKDQSLWQKIKSFINDIVAKIKKAYAGLDPYSAEGRFVKEQLDNFEQLQSMWIDALVDAGETYSAIGGMVQADASSQSVAPTMLSERTWTESEYVQAREATAKQIVKDLGVSLETAYKYIDDINSVARLISDDRARLDYEPNLDSSATVIKPNSDYKWSVDMSTLCAKRLLFTGTFDAIQRALPNTAFDSDDIVRIRGMMEERGYEVACGICYVESTRREIGTITADFIERYKEAQKTGKPITRINSEGKAVELRKTKDQMQTTSDASTNQFFAEKGYTPTLAELNTTDIDLVKRDHPLVYEAYLNYMNARGQSKPKLLETRAEYKGEILKHFKYKSAVTSRNNAGGLRLQSFSDFEVPHLIDMMQITMDMARVGLKSQAYTKVPNFAEAFGNTGIKINLSLIAKGTGVDSKGNLIFDDKEGINHTEAFRLRDKFSKNVGTILVGKNDAHIIAAMADPRIDYIIPFHKSSWKESLYDALGLTGYADYTDTQHEKPIDSTRTIKDFDPSEYWDFSKTGDENAQIYIEKCREDGRIPKFPQFQGYEGYWKLLIDFKMYDNDGVGSPQEVVQPIFDNAVNERILSEYEGGHRSFPVAKDVVEDFVREKKKDVKLSDRDSEGNALSAEQQEFFKDSKVRDEEGRLTPVYHGTPSGGFTEFKLPFYLKTLTSAQGAGFYFTDKANARQYMRGLNGKSVSKKQLYKVYLNITNPLEISEYSKGAISDEAFRRIMARGNYEWGMDHTDIDKTLQYATLDSDRLAEMVRVFNGEEILTVMKEELGYDGVRFTDKYGDIWVAWDKSQIKNTTNKAPTSNPDIRYSDRVTDPETLDFLENQEHVTVYRAMQLIDGKLYPPMNAYTYDDNGKKVLMPPSEIGAWEQSVERPDLIDPKTGKFKLDKGKVDSGKQGTPVPAAYNPYIHTSLSMLNDQFTSAYQRSNLVVVKGVVPKSELTSGYRAQYAKDTVGETEWHSGVVSTQLPESRKVILSRWFKPVEIMSDDAVAQGIKEMLGDTGIEIPYNVVSPKLRRSLEKLGVPIGEGRGIRNLPAKSEVKYSDRDYSYESIVSKPDMKLTTVGGNVPSNRADVVAEAKKNAAKVGKFNPKDGSVSVRVNDTGDDVVMSTGGLRHCLDRRFDVNAPVTVKAGEILQNSIRINEMTPENTNADSSYVLIGAARNEKGELYIVRSVVNRFKNELVSMDVLYAINAKTEPNLGIKKGNQAGAYPQGTLSNDSFLTDSTISIAQLLEFVNRYFPDILPESVLRHFGHDARPEGKLGESVLYSDRDSYAPVFYSHMGKVIDDIKLAKMGAGGVVSYLKGKGVKNEEIKWSGIEAFLEGKKSVTKEELQEFVAGSQLQIVEQMSGSASFIADDGKTYEGDAEFKNAAYAKADRLNIGRDRVQFIIDTERDMEAYAYDVGNMSNTILTAEIVSLDGNLSRWSKYKLYGGTNYRELVFQMPNSSFSNQMMRAHWGQDAEGVLAHARIQDFDTSDGKMLFIEEIQSDWHNEGATEGYFDSKDDAKISALEAKANDLFFKVEDYSTETTGMAGEWETIENTEKGAKLLREYREAQAAYDNAMNEAVKKIPDAPFRDSYHEYVLKRLIRMAAEEGYDSIGWTTADIQSQRWSDEYAEGYRIEYDQNIPKFLRKYGKRWGATVGNTTINGDAQVWSMPITASMKQSVLHEGQPMYSDRSDSDISNRELLVNALESAALNDIERKKLAQYKEKIALIDKEEQHLHNLKEEIKELSFAKGKKDVERIKALQFEAKQTENRINTYDRQLLALEASAPLKALLEREKKMAYKKAEQRGKDALAAYRERAARTQRELLRKARESRQKGIDGRKRTEMRHKIKSVVSDLNQLLLHGSKERNVKLGLQAAVASALEAVNMDTVAADERIAKLEQELMKAKTPEKIQEISRKIDNIRDMGDRMESRLEELRRAYVAIKNSEQGVPDYYKHEASLIADKVDSVLKKVGNTPLRNMSLSQLEEVYNLYRMVLTTVRNVNSVFVQGKLDDLHKNVSEIMTEIEPIKPLKEERLAIGDWWRKQSWNEMIPVYAFERIGSQKFTSFFWETVRGQNTFATDISEAKEFSSAVREKYGYAKWDLDKIHEFKLEDGRTLRVSLRHMMSIYAYSKREQALEHMRVGGFFFNDKNTFRKEKGVLKVIKSNEAGYTVSEDVFQTIKAAMTQEQIQYVDEMQDYLTKMGEKGNEVSRVLWGIDIFKEKVYFPLKSSRDFIYQANQPAQESSLKNDGMTKETIPHASNPIVLEAFDDVWANHVERMSKYHAFVLPIENLNKIHNYGTWVGTESMSMSTMLRARHSDAVNEYLTQFIRDLNGASSMDGVSNPVFSFFNKFKKTAVAASLSVVVQQPTAILRASAVIDPKYFVGKPSLNLSEKWEELQKYAPIAIIKDIGGFDAGGGRQITEWLNADTKRGVDKVMGKIDDITMLGAALGDKVGWTAIWEAVKRETLNNNPKLSPKSEEFLKIAGDRFTEVIVLTQVYDSTLSRSGFMRSKHESVKMMTSFMGEPTVSFNMLMNAVTQAKNKRITKKQAARTVGAVYASVLAASIAASMVYALRDDDDDEAYLEKFAESLSGKLKDEINPLNMLPIMRDIMSILDGWDVERTDVAVFKDLKDAFDGLFSENKSAWRKVEDFAGAIASSFGIPLKNVLRTGREMYNLFENIFDSDTPTGAGVKDSIVAGITGNEKSNGQQLYEAILNGDHKQIERVSGRFKNQTAIDTAIRKALRDNDPRIKEAAQAIIDEDFSKYTDIANEIVGEGYFSEENIVAAIRAEINAMTDDEETEETEDREVSIYEMDYFFSAVVGGDTVMAHAIREDIIRTKVANGDERDDAEESFNSSFTNKCGKEYKKGNVSYSNAVSMLVSYGGKTEEKAASKVQYWNFQMDYPEYDDLSESAVGAYYEHAAPVGIGVPTYYSYYKSKSKCKGTDSNGDGRTDSGTVKAEIMAVIDSLPITNAQKDALYFAEGWAASKLWEAPWR